MNMAALIIIFVLVLVAIAIWVVYNVSAAYQQTITISVPFDNTYRYVPNLSINRRYKLDTIKVTVSGSIKRDSSNSGTILPASNLKNLVTEHITQIYKDSLILQEAHTFMVEETVLKRQPLVKNPTVENLSILFFNKLSSLTPNIGCQLLDVTIVSDGIESSHSRFKPSNYSL